TDEDREGESIAWHLLEVLGPRVPVRRMVFHEITRPAIERAVEETRDLDRRLVDAQEARRILDRLYGYEVSPVLWRKVMPRLSAGRVQSVATRILVERERARMRFRSASWWDLTATLDAAGHGFDASLTAVEGRRLATGRDFDETGQLSPTSPGRAGSPPPDQSPVVMGEVAAVDLARRLEGSSFRVDSLEEKPFRRSPHAPFMTSTLQQEAGRKLRFSAQRTMSVAQRLYEAGHITYMRTDSTELSDTAVEAARAQARALYGAESVPASPRQYRSKVRNAQEAHEAIRPAGDSFRLPRDIRGLLSPDEGRLYELVWTRTVASQMADATGTSATVRLSGTAERSEAGTAEQVELVARGRVIRSPGFLRAYVAGADDPEAELEDAERHLPELTVGQELPALAVGAAGHATQPPARYTEASLVRALEELGVGRPSTYASIMGTIQDRGYVWRKGSALVPSFIAFAVVGLLEQYFGDLVDYGFTASMEDELDHIAGGREEVAPYLHRFYFGNGRPGLKEVVSVHLADIDAREVSSIPIGADAQGQPIVVRVGRYGPYLRRGEDRAAVPEDLPPDELTVERATELLAAGSGDRVLGSDPESGLAVVVRAGRFGPYVQLGEAEPGAKEKPRTSSLLSSMDPVTIGLQEALRLLSLPRSLGADPGSGEEVVVANGRFGPYVKRAGDTRSLASEDQLFELSLPEALELLAQPKAARGRRAAAVPLAELGADPESGQPIVLREGRFGPYVTDGETNASLRRGDSPESLTPERAAELLAERRAAGPSTRRRAPRAGGSRAGSGADGTASSGSKGRRGAAAKKPPAKKPPAKGSARTRRKAG
ncbi:MAG: type I DNA topoisomerase, partial [Acidimicrobiales bacterium]